MPEQDPVIARFRVGQRWELPPVGSWPATVHVFDDTSAYAVVSALAAQRPLLVRGEPGSGKSQLARAAAHVLGRLFVSEVVQARSEVQELQWQYDAVARLGEAQALAVAGDHQRVHEVLDPMRYLAPGPLWWAFDYHSAERQHAACMHPPRRPDLPPGWDPAEGSVLLIDEIDKAEMDLPNGLLETLGNGAFPVPWRDEAVGLAADAPPPLVVVTTNEERQLPAAFERRCLVLHLALYEGEALEGWLVERGGKHFADELCGEDIRKRAARLLRTEREAALEGGLSPPGQAEYLDILRALSALAPGDPERQTRLLARVAPFAVHKGDRGV